MAGGHSYGVMPAMDPTNSRTSSRTSLGTLPIYRAFRTRQSRLRMCSQRTAPCTGSPDGSRTSDAYPLTLLVIGQTKDTEVRKLNRLAESTSAGLRPACSRPACGSKFNQTRSPASGT